jgi:hypothetical protein
MLQIPRAAVLFVWESDQDGEHQGVSVMAMGWVRDKGEIQAQAQV